ncbi:macro domain-containing protein [Streptomyces sp. NPDC059627]
MNYPTTSWPRGSDHHCVRTSAPARHVVRAVGERDGVDEPAAELMASGYMASLRMCDEVSAGSVAAGSQSTGTFGFPSTRRARSAWRPCVAPALRSDDQG